MSLLNEMNGSDAIHTRLMFLKTRVVPSPLTRLASIGE